MHTADARAAATSPSRPYAVYVLLLLLAANTLSYADRHLFSMLIPAMKTEFAISDAVLGLIGGPAFIASYVLLSLPLARLADRGSKRGVLAGAVALWSAATALCGAAASAVQLALGRVLVGVGEAGGMPPSQSILAEMFDERRRSSAMGVLASGTYFGLLLGLTGGAAIAHLWGWRWAFYALALPGLPLGLLIWATVPRARAARAAVPDRQSMLAVMRACWKIRSFRLLALGMGLFNVFGYAGAIWMPAYFMRSHGLSMVEAGTWLGLGAAAGGIAGSLASGAIVDALRPRDERWQLRVPGLAFLAAFPLFIVMLATPGGASFMLLGISIPVVALIAVVTAFLSSLWAGPSFGAAALLVPPDRRAQAAAMLVIVINVMGSGFGPVVAGLVSDALTARLGVEALRYSLLSMSVLNLAGGALFLRAARHYPADLVLTHGRAK